MRYIFIALHIIFVLFFWEMNDPSTSELIKLMQVDLFLFSQVLFGDATQPMHYHIRNKTPDFHREINKELAALQRGEKLAIVAPRGHAKSTEVSLIYPLHQIFYGQEHFVLMISESEKQSKLNVEALGNEIEHNPVIKALFGDRKGETWGKEEKIIIGGLNREIRCKILVRGTGQRVRGLKFGPYRPTLTIIDDGEGDGNSSSPTQREEFRRWLNGAVIPGSDDARLVFIGTILDNESYLNRIAGRKAYNNHGIRRIKGWKSLFFQAILQNTRRGEFVSSGKEILVDGIPAVLWPDRKPYKWLMAERSRLESEGDLAFFYQEYQNIPMDDSFRIFKERDIQYWDGFYFRESDINYIMRTEGGRREKVPVNVYFGMDPASSENVKADYTVIMVIGIDSEYNIFIIEYFRGQSTPMDGADKLWDMMGEYNPKNVNIEETGHVMLTNYIIRKSKEHGKFYAINPKKAIKKKYDRIMELQPLFGSKSVYLKEEHIELESELLNFKKHGAAKKDTLDALKWATDDMNAPSLEKQGNKWVMPMPVAGSDWETGRLFYD